MFRFENRTEAKERASLVAFINELFPDDLEVHLEAMRKSKAGHEVLLKYLAETAEAEKKEAEKKEAEKKEAEKKEAEKKEAEKKDKGTPNNNNVQGSEEQSKVQEDDDRLMHSWQLAMLNNPTGFKSLHPLVQATMTSKVRKYRLRRAAAYAAANGGVIKSGFVTTKVPSGVKDSEVKIKQADPSGEHGAAERR